MPTDYPDLAVPETEGRTRSLCFRSLPQESKLAGSGLGHLLGGVEILSDKNKETYRGIFQRRAIKPEEFVMVGNSLRSDIVPVVELGGRAIHIPYEVTWAHEEVREDELPKDGWQRLETIRELPAALETL